MSLKFCYYIPRTVMAFKTSTFFSQIRTICSATQLSRNRVDFLNVGVKFKNIINSVGALPKRPLTLLVGSGRNLAANCKKESLFNTANQGRKLSATTVWLSKSFQRDQSKSRDKRGMLCRMFLGALGVSATATCCIHTGAQVTMAAGPDALKGNLESAKGDWRETKDLLLSLTVDERRQYYRTPGYKTLDSIPTWSPSAGEKPRYSRNKKLDGKISLYSGDITQLEIDAIVNAANKTLLGGGGVDGAIHRAAGPKLKEECASLIGCETGEAKVTGGYGLPAKYVIHTVGPVAVGAVGEEERQALRACYKNSLEAAAATLTGARSLAFPCISTGIYGYPPEQAVHEALATVREYLDEHPDKLDRVIFCVFLTSDKELYLKNLPLYFPGAPAEARVKSKL